MTDGPNSLTSETTTPIAGLGRSEWSLRFPDAGHERDFRLWHVRASLPIVRVAMTGTMLSWAGACAAAPWIKAGTLFASAMIIFPVVVPLVIAALLASYHNTWWKYTLALCAFTNTATGFVAIVFTIGLLEHPALGIGAVLIVTYYGGTVFQLRTWPAVAAISPYALATLAYIWTAVPDTLPVTEAAGDVVLVLIAGTTSIAAAYASELASRRAFAQEHLVEAQRVSIRTEKERADRLLLNILPPAIAERLKAAPEAIAESHEEVTILFSDIVGFTPMAADLSPDELVALLNELVAEFDALANKHGIEKIKTIGDAYMAVAGAPTARDDHAQAAARFAIDMRDFVSRWSKEHGKSLQIRIGLATGPIVAGVIGTNKFAYDLWGDVVNIAARMESHSEPGQIQVTDTTRDLLAEQFELTARGEIEVKGKGKMTTWFLVAEN